jgi:hypothetical protein
VECAFGEEQGNAAGVRARKLDGRLHAFTAGTAEKHLRGSSSRAQAQPGGQLRREFRHVALQHRRAATVEFVLECCHNRGVIVAGVVHTVSGQKVQNASPIAP